MTNPPGLVVGAYGQSDAVLFSLWNYTDAPIEVTVGANPVPPTPELPNDFFNGNVSVPSNSTPSTAGNTELATPTYYPYQLPVGVYNLEVQTDGNWYQVAANVEVGVPVSTGAVGGGIPSFPAGHHPVWRDTP